VFGEADRGVLAAGVVAVHQLAGKDGVALSVAVPQRDPQRREDGSGGPVRWADGRPWEIPRLCGPTPGMLVL
jgi:hypothetical protein